MNNKQIFDLNIQDILNDWSTSDAIREIIANAIDEANLTQTQKPIINYDENNQSLIITDFGRGIKIDNFTQNENDEKRNCNQMIGKFGIGLKDAIAVLFNNNKKIIFNSMFGSFTPTLLNKSGIDQQIKTIHMQYDPNNKIKIGTTIKIENITKNEYLSGIDNFLIYSKRDLIFKCDNGEIFNRNISSEIFLNGMKISDDGDFLFSYNITNPNAKLRSSINRERKMLSRDAYRNSIISLLQKTIINKANLDIGIWISNYIINNHNNTKNNEWSYIDIKKLVVSHTTKKVLLGSKIHQTNPAYETYAINDGYSIIWIGNNDYKSFLDD